ncbi:TPA: hypothetical protein DEP21_04350 [Patescibacteria group bacterium]|nr:hypothetical protein [Candidatus Gracilibacteria bacterium]
MFVVISAIFVWVKSPYINIPFSGPFHAAKYAAYVEPAKRMQEHGPFWYQKNYLRTTAGNPFKYDGTYKTFSSYPILEWILAGTQELFPLESYEHNARVVMTIIGIILLLTCYVFLQRFFTRKQILFLITLLALNSVFQFFTHLTVLDPINLIFFFIALHILLN